ncbi:hypothetical protein [Paraburkholderia terrae]|uniref:hypothetical protein n=1 Tax=Paraburkholderia terrae TaxID=311230 RepID=UPI0033656380
MSANTVKNIFAKFDDLAPKGGRERAVFSSVNQAAWRTLTNARLADIEQGLFALLKK